MVLLVLLPRPVHTSIVCVVEATELLQNTEGGTVLQELQTPELQPLSMESKAALALLKYLPLNPQVIPQVTLPSHGQPPWLP